ncbi:MULTISPECIES: RNA-binding protein [unclassified Lactococcus]|uniref:YlmH family RNA-binding protein n=1 Tax=unclassified Lactococcus TaxID=2643510 RepID=UPI0011CA369A|nr:MULTISPECIES: RNA-binding protein [unclassified Lactococcus]MQW23746.1 cell division protein [Lactococcus sp. dk101]TXK37459.1 RNA-binding protein [Lactococcus sp. dk310]TXK48802.1 RNA-binding protein [Lactococcus sp. dk322]
MSNDNIYQHFKAEERIFIDRVMDWLDQVENAYAVISTYFLNPREAFILKSLLGKKEIQCFSSQDLAETELTKFILAPDFYVLDQADFDLSLLKISYAIKFNQLTHAQVLGAFLNQTGIKRQELGDIVITDEAVQVFVSRHLVELFKSIDKIARISVKIKEIPLSELTETVTQASAEILLVDNLRIDKIIASSFKVSRNIAKNMLESKKVKLNYLEIEKKDFSVEIGDLVSVRGFGRIKIIDELGITKKGKQKISVEITRNKK